MSSNRTYLIVRQGEGWLCLKTWRMCSHTLTWFSTLALLQGLPLFLSLHQSIRWSTGKNTELLLHLEPWRWTPVLLSLCCGPCQQSLPCRPCGHTSVLQTSGCTQEIGDALFTTKYPHHISLMFVSSVAVEPWSCVWVHSFFLLFFSRS